jgi:hypothetical protein
MENATISLNMGVILCKHCHTEIETFDAEKVTTYYSDCKASECMETRANMDQQPVL